MEVLYSAANNDSKRVSDLDRLAARQKSQIDALNSDKVNLQTNLDELRIQNSRLKNQVNKYCNCKFKFLFFFDPFEIDSISTMSRVIKP